MLDILSYIMDLVFIAFAVYGIIVFREWHKAADKIDSMLDEMKQSLEDDANPTNPVKPV